MGDNSLALERSAFFYCYFITEGAFTLEIEGAGNNVRRFFICGGDNSVSIACVY